jgi:hypothetical protein
MRYLIPMKNTRQQRYGITFFALGVLAFCCIPSSSLWGRIAIDPQLSSSNPYIAITNRNLFALKDPPPPLAVETTKKIDVPSVLLTGITTLNNKKRAFMESANPVPSGKPGEPARKQSWMLMEGEKMDGLEVISIDTKSLTVRIKQDDAPEPRDLNFKDNGIKTASVGLAPAVPVPSPFGAPPTPGAIPPPGNNPFGQPNSGLRSFPTRNMRVPGAPGEGASANTGGLNNGVVNPQGGLNAFGNSSPSQGSGAGLTAGGIPIPPERSPEETVALYEASRLARESLVKAGLRPNIGEHIYLRQNQAQQQSAPQSGK